MCYLAQPNKGNHEKVATVTEDAAYSCPLSQAWMWLLMTFSPSFNSQPFYLTIVTKIEETDNLQTLNKGDSNE